MPENTVDSIEDTDVLTMNLLNGELGVNVKPEDINRSHRVSIKRSSKPRLTIVLDHFTLLPCLCLNLSTTFMKVLKKINLL